MTSQAQQPSPALAHSATESEGPPQAPTVPDTFSSSPQCPRCGSDRVRRANRRGISECLFSLVYLYPFRCQACRHRFRRFSFERYERIEKGFRLKEPRS